MRGEWLVPFRGRKASGPYDQNFLWRHKNIYVMDNHRAAMWCWLQHIDPRHPHSLLHIDRHYDSLASRLDEWLANCPADLRGLSINEYLDCDYRFNELGFDQRMKVIRWDNYLSIYLARYGNSIHRLHMCTHDEGDAPERHFTKGDLWDVPDNIDYWLDPKHRPWILNLDVDYLFWHDPEQTGLMVSDEYLRATFEKVQQKIKDETIAVTTIALSPEQDLTGGWAPAEQVAARILQILGIDFALPP
jgi:UPF0489 domain